jgi:hypothetical protein
MIRSLTLLLLALYILQWPCRQVHIARSLERAKQSSNEAEFQQDSLGCLFPIRFGCLLCCGTKPNDDIADDHDPYQKYMNLHREARQLMSLEYLYNLGNVSSGTFVSKPLASSALLKSPSVMQLEPSPPVTDRPSVMQTANDDKSGLPAIPRNTVIR